MAEYLRSEYVAIQDTEGTIESWKYKHYECPMTNNPSKRGR
jgi:hypothetical protein